MPNPPLRPPLPPPGPNPPPLLRYHACLQVPFEPQSESAGDAACVPDPLLLALHLVQTRSREQFPPDTLDGVEEFDLQLVGIAEDGELDSELLEKLMGQITDGALSAKVGPGRAGSGRGAGVGGGRGLRGPAPGVGEKQGKGPCQRPPGGQPKRRVPWGQPTVAGQRGWGSWFQRLMDGDVEERQSNS